MEDKDIDLLIQQFSTSADRWTEQLFDSTARHSNMTLKNVDRGFNLTLTLTSISCAFLAIAVPLIKGDLSFVIDMTIVCFLLNAIIGVVGLVITIRRDKKILPENFDWERGVLNGYQKQATDIRLKLFSYKEHKTPQLLAEVISDAKAYFSEKEKLEAAANERSMMQLKEPSAMALKHMNSAFWASFIIAVLSLTIWLGIQMIGGTATTNKSDSVSTQVLKIVTPQ